MAEAMFNSIVLTWSVPEEPNGVILSYQVTYTVNGSPPVSTNTTASSTTFTISSLPPLTSVSNISVTAYTRVGEGEPATLVDTLTPQLQLMNVVVEVVSATSVRVSWDRIALPEITGYTVYYSQTGNRQRQQQSGEESVTVPSSASSVVIGGLESNVQYQFQVVAIVLKGGIVRFSERSNMTTASTAATAQFKCTPSLQVGPIAGGVVMFLAVVLAIIAVVCLLAVWLYCRYY